MEIRIRVKLTDSEYVVSTSLFMIVQLERHYKTSASELATGMSLEQLGYLAWLASQADHNPPVRLDDFLRNVVNLTVVDAEEDEDPTPGAP